MEANPLPVVSVLKLIGKVVDMATDKAKAEIDNALLAEATAGHTEAAAIKTPEALLVDMQSHGASQSKGGTYVYLMSRAWAQGVFDLKAKRNAGDFTAAYDAWYLAKNPGEDEIPAGDRSYWNRWAQAGFASKEKPWMREWCDKVFACKNASLSTRATAVSKLLELKGAPTAEEWEKIRPNETAGGAGGTTLKSKSSALVRALAGVFEATDKDNMPAEAFTIFEKMQKDAALFASIIDAIPVTPKAGAKSTKAAERKAAAAAAIDALRAKFRAEKPKQDA
jgi:hypothetical protein